METGRLRRGRKRVSREDDHEKRSKKRLKLSNQGEGLCCSESDSDSESCLESEDDDDGISLRELEEQLEKNAAMKNLTVTNVKSILHHVLSDKELIALAKASAGEDEAMEGVECTGKKVEPKMTRARCKHTRDIESSYMQNLFLDMELSEDSGDDQEYVPDLESEITENDSLLSSDTLSPMDYFTQSTKDETKQLMKPQDIPNTMSGLFPFDEPLFKVPESPRKRLYSKGESMEKELISNRTRSKFPLKDLSLETLEAEFCAPDFDPEIYDSPAPGEADEEDVDWKTFLRDLTKEESLFNDSIDDVDDDFNYMANEDEELVDQEEYRNDRAVRVTQRELQDLFDELLEGFEPLLPGFQEINHDLAGSVFSEGQRLQLAAQFQQHLQLLVQVSLLCYYDPSLEEEANTCKEFVNELKTFNDRAKELTVKGKSDRSKSAFCITGINEAARILESHKTPPLPEHCHYFTPMSPGEHEPQAAKKRQFTVPAPIPCMAAMKFAKCPYFASYPELIPSQGMVSRSSKCTRSPDLGRLRFTVAEDNLLAIGLAQFKNNFKLINQQLLPTKTPKQLKNRRKNLCSKREPLNAVKVFKKTKILPPLLTDFHVIQPRAIFHEPLCQTLRVVLPESKIPEWILRVAEKFQCLQKKTIREEVDENVKAYMKRNQLRSIAVKGEEEVNTEDCSDFHIFQSGTTQDAVRGSEKDRGKEGCGQQTPQSTEQSPKATQSRASPDVLGCNLRSPLSQNDLKSANSSSIKVNLTTSCPVLQPALIQVLPAVPTPSSTTLKVVQTPKRLKPLKPLQTTPESGAQGVKPKPLPRLKAVSPSNAILPNRSAMTRRSDRTKQTVSDTARSNSPLPNVVADAEHSPVTALINHNESVVVAQDCDDSVPESNEKEKSEELPTSDDTQVQTNVSSSTRKGKGKLRVQRGKKSSSQNSKVKFNLNEKRKEKYERYAEDYFQRVKETVNTKQPELWKKFVMIMDAANQKDCSRVEIYHNVASLFKAYPDMVDDFVPFLTQEEACEVGKFMVWLDFDRARTFLLQCEAMFFKNMSLYEEMLKTLLDAHRNRKSSTEFLELITPMLRGNEALVQDFSRFFGDQPPPPCHDDDFEVITYNEAFGGFGHVDDFEEILLSKPDEDVQCCNKKNRILNKVGRRSKLNKNIRLPKSPNQNSTRRTARNAKRAAVRTLITGANSRKPRCNLVLAKEDLKEDFSDLGVSSLENLDDDGPKKAQDIVVKQPVMSEEHSQVRETTVTWSKPEITVTKFQRDSSNKEFVNTTSIGHVGALTKLSLPLRSEARSSESVTKDQQESNDTPDNLEWTREEDRIIFAAFQEADSCNEVFSKISGKLSGKKPLDVLNRLKHLMKTYAMPSQSDNNDDDNSSLYTS